MTTAKRTENILDNIIFGFVILFLLTLHNSIFLNQIGYYGALLLIIAKAIMTKKNPFHRTGLEWFFVLFLTAEILSTIFSINPGNAFHNLLKRVLLIPIVYVIFSAADSRQKAVTFFKVYITGALITLLIYLVFAYEHFIHQLYQLETKGPSPFQYVMTAGGLISFCVIFLFAFLINEKTSWKYRVAILFAFILTLLALAASYTRAAWIGAAAGIFIILVLKRKWIIIIPLLIVFSIILFTQKTSSVLIIESNSGNSRKIEYAGKLFSISSDENNIYLAGYENGVLSFRNSSLVPVVQTKAPVTFFSKWNEDIYFSFLVDQRIEIYKSVSGRLQRMHELISPGVTTSYVLSNNTLYIADKDSGLTVFSDPLDPKKKYRYPEYTGISRMSVNAENLVFFADDSILQVLTLENALPSQSIFKKNYFTKFGFITLIDNNILFASEGNTRLLTIEDGQVRSKDINRELSNINSFSCSDDKLFASGFTNHIFELEYPITGHIKIVNRKQLPFVPSTFVYHDSTFFYTDLNISRLNSIFDPYYSTNIQRLYQWQAGIAILKDYPLFGVGDIDMKKVYTEYMNYYEKETFGHLHNNYIQLLAALGIFGFSIVIILLIKIGIIHFNIYKALQNIDFASSFALGAFGTFIGFLISGLAEWNFGDHEIITMVWFILGLNLAFLNNYKQIQEPETKQEYVNE